MTIATGIKESASLGTDIVAMSTLVYLLQSQLINPSACILKLSIHKNNKGENDESTIDQNLVDVTGALHLGYGRRGYHSTRRVDMFGQ
jgi:hypothetical protein